MSAMDRFSQRMNDAIAEARESTIALLMEHALVPRPAADAECRCGMAWIGDHDTTLRFWASHVAERMGFMAPPRQSITVDVFREERP